ncbi:unnamed protein product [Pedinophyceae sp. YPF-701]|nr:unnamed protein product [Pedinophyceae sp. YPF-701]
MAVAAGGGAGGRALAQAANGACSRNDPTTGAAVTQPAHCCWHGVSCCSSGLAESGTCVPGDGVSELVLPGNNITGAMRLDLLAPLAPTLTFLELSGNRLSGPLPPEVGLFTELTSLRLRQNQLSGPLPDALNSLGKLAVLLLGRNDLEGSVVLDATQMTSLAAADLAYNRLSGPLPASLFASPTLAIVDVTGNRISGFPPAPTIAARTQLQALLASDNAMGGGALPAWIFDLAALEELELANNGLAGSLGGVCQLPNLRHVQLAGNRLSGPVPCLATHVSLEVLNVSSNALEGPLPLVYSHMTRLRVLDVSNNPAVTGRVPEGLGLVPTLRSVVMQGTSMRHVGAAPNSRGEYLPEWLTHSLDENHVPDHEGVPTGCGVPEAISPLHEPGFPHVHMDPDYSFYTGCPCMDELVDVLAARADAGAAWAQLVLEKRVVPSSADVPLPTDFVFACSEDGVDMGLVLGLGVGLGVPAVIVLCVLVALAVRRYACMHGTAELAWLAGLPEGEATVVVSDIKGSTQLWEWDPPTMAQCQNLHDTLMREILARHNGIELWTEGDSFTMAFKTPADAVLFSMEVQRALLVAEWPAHLLEHYLCSEVYQTPGDPMSVLLFRGIRVRMGIAKGDLTSVVSHGERKFSGSALPLALEVQDAADGGQVLVEGGTFDAVADVLTMIAQRARRQSMRDGSIGMMRKSGRMSMAIDGGMPSHCTRSAASGGRRMFTSARESNNLSGHAAPTSPWGSQMEFKSGVEPPMSPVLSRMSGRREDSAPGGRNVAGSHGESLESENAGQARASNNGQVTEAVAPRLPSSGDSGATPPQGDTHARGPAWKPGTAPAPVKLSRMGLPSVRENCRESTGLDGESGLNSGRGLHSGRFEGNRSMPFGASAPKPPHLHGLNQHHPFLSDNQERAQTMPGTLPQAPNPWSESGATPPSRMSLHVQAMGDLDFARQSGHLGAPTEVSGAGDHTPKSTSDVGDIGPVPTTPAARAAHTTGRRSMAAAVPQILRAKIAGALGRTSMSPEVDPTRVGSPGGHSPAMAVDLGEHLVSSNGPNGSAMVRLVQVLPEELLGRTVFFNAPGTLGKVSASYFDAPGARDFCAFLAYHTDVTPQVDYSLVSRVTLVFVSIPFWQRVSASLPEASALALWQYRLSVRETIKLFGGYESQVLNDVFLLAFSSPRCAVEWAMLANEVCILTQWPRELLQHPDCATTRDSQGRVLLSGLSLRVGIYEGLPTQVIPHPKTGRADYFGPFINRAARLCYSACNPGQIVVTKEVSSTIAAEWSLAKPSSFKPPSELSTVWHPNMAVKGGIVGSDANQAFSTTGGVMMGLLPNLPRSGARGGPQMSQSKRTLLSDLALWASKPFVHRTASLTAATRQARRPMFPNIPEGGSEHDGGPVDGGALSAKGPLEESDGVSDNGEALMAHKTEYMRSGRHASPPERAAQRDSAHSRRGSHGTKLRDAPRLRKSRSMKRREAEASKSGPGADDTGPVERYSSYVGNAFDEDEESKHRKLLRQIGQAFEVASVKGRPLRAVTMRDIGVYQFSGVPEAITVSSIIPWTLSERAAPPLDTRKGRLVETCGTEATSVVWVPLWDLQPLSDAKRNIARHMLVADSRQQGQLRNDNSKSKRRSLDSNRRASVDDEDAGARKSIDFRRQSTEHRRRRHSLNRRQTDNQVQQVHEVHAASDLLASHVVRKSKTPSGTLERPSMSALANSNNAIAAGDSGQKATALDSMTAHRKQQRARVGVRIKGNSALDGTNSPGGSGGRAGHVSQDQPRTATVTFGGDRRRPFARQDGELGSAPVDGPIREEEGNESNARLGVAARGNRGRQGRDLEVCVHLATSGHGPSRGPSDGVLGDSHIEKDP